MANLFFTGFNGMNNANRGDFFDNSGGIVSGGRTGQGMQGNDFIKSFSTTDNTIILGMALKVNGGPSSDRPIFQIAEGGTFHAALSIGSGGVMKVWRDGVGWTQLGSNLPVAFPVTNVWRYIEFLATIHDSAGVVKVRLDETEIFSMTGQDTKNGGTGIPTRFLHDIGNFIGSVIDDLYINDSTGSVDNTFWGDTRIDPLNTSAEDACDFTPSSGTDNEAMIDDGDSPDDDTTYNESSTVGHKDAFTVAGFAGTGSIRGIRLRGRMKKTDAGSRTARLFMNSGGTVLNGTAASPSTGYSSVGELHTAVDPNTGVAFADAAAVNAVKVGYEIVT